jgi:hypothetical protein
MRPWKVGCVLEARVLHFGRPLGRLASQRPARQSGPRPQDGRERCRMVGRVDGACAKRVRASFVRPPVQCELRDLTRKRANLVRDRTQVLNRLQKILEDANLKLTAVDSDINGVSALEMLRALVVGTTDPKRWLDLRAASCAKRRPNWKRP